MRHDEDGRTGKLAALWARRVMLPIRKSPLEVTGAWKRWGPLLVPTLLVGAACAALAVDCPLSRWFVEQNCPGSLVRLFGIGEPFGNAFGVLMIALAIWTLDPARRWGIGRLLAMSLGAGLAADVVKMLIARVRPNNFNFQGTVGDTFGQWLPFLGAGSIGQSFPSAHVATGVGVAVALAWLYPRGRWLFATLAVLVACQRIAAGAHYLSDTLCGAAIGWIVATAFLHNAWLAARFERLEIGYETRRKRTAQSARPGRGQHVTVEPTAQDDQSRAA